MIKKILIALGVSAFGVFWWIGFMKVREMAKTEVHCGCGDQGFMGR
jgi:hypothetical protein